MIRQDWSSLRKLMAIRAATGGAAAVEDTATGNPLTFLTDLAKPLKSLIANFLPVQASGTPSPDNILPITGWTEVNVYHGADQTDYDTYPATFPSTIYGGYVDMMTGEVWKAWESVDMGSLEWEYLNQNANRQAWKCITAIPKKSVESSSDIYNGYSTIFKRNTFGSTWMPYNIVPYGTAYNQTVVCFAPNAYETSEEVNDALTDIPLVYELASPVLIATLTPQQINAIKGNNTVWSDANGSMTAVYLKKA